MSNDNQKENNKVSIKPFITLFLISIVIFTIIYFLHSKNIENRFNDTLQNYEKSMSAIFNNMVITNGDNENIYTNLFQTNNNIENLKLSFEVGFKMLESSINEIMKNSNDILQFWFAFLSVIMIVFTIIGFFLNNNIYNNIINQAREQLEIIKNKSNILIQELEDKYNNAIKNINKIVKEETKKLIQENNLFNLGLQAYNNKDYQSAIYYFNKVINLNIKNSVAYYNRGLAKYYLKDYEGAIEDYNKAIELNSNYSLAYNNRGLAKLKLGEIEEAIEDYNKAIELNPNYSLAYNNRGLAKLKLGEIEEAIKDFIKVYELDNNNEIKEKSKRQLIKFAKNGNELSKKFCEEHNINYNDNKE